MKIITFYSYKGGVGRTLAVANVARYLTLFGFNVVAVDFDLEAPGLHYKIFDERQNIDDENPNEKVRNKKGAIDFFHDYVTQDFIPDSFEDFIIDIDVPFADEGSLKFIHSGVTPKFEDWQKLGRVNWKSMFYEGEYPPGLPLFLKFFELIEDECNPDFVLIDSRTGITEVGGIATTKIADMVVCMFLNNKEHLYGTREIIRSISSNDENIRGNEVTIIPVLSRIPIIRQTENEEEQDNDLVKFLFEDSNYGKKLEKCSLIKLHFDEKLLKQERIYLGGSISMNDSTLVPDYKKLIYKMIPKDNLASKIFKNLKINF